MGDSEVFWLWVVLAVVYLTIGFGFGILLGISAALYQSNSQSTFCRALLYFLIGFLMGLFGWPVCLFLVAKDY